jgi:hypothetical protein
MTPIVRASPAKSSTHLHLAFEDDDEVVGRVARPEEDLSYLRCPRLPVALKDLDLVFP